MKTLLDIAMEPPQFSVGDEVVVVKNFNDVLTWHIGKTYLIQKPRIFTSQGVVWHNCGDYNFPETTIRKLTKLDKALK